MAKERRRKLLRVKLVSLCLILLVLVNLPHGNKQKIHKLKPIDSSSTAMGFLNERKFFARASRGRYDIPSTTTTAIVTTTTTRVVKQEKKVSTTAPVTQPVTTTTRQVEPTTTVVQTAEYDASCLGHKMTTRDEAHRCWDGLIAKYPWDRTKAFNVMYCESTGKSDASNGSHWGLFQLDRGPYYDPAQNIDIAYREYYVPRGWRPWACA